MMVENVILKGRGGCRRCEGGGRMRDAARAGEFDGVSHGDATGVHVLLGVGRVECE